MQASGGFGEKGGFTQLDFDNVVIEDEERALYILNSDYSDEEKKQFKQKWNLKIFFISEIDSFIDLTREYPPLSVFIPFLGGQLKEFHLRIINYLYENVNDKLMCSNVYIEGAGNGLGSFGKNPHNLGKTLEFIDLRLPLDQ